MKGEKVLKIIKDNYIYAFDSAHESIAHVDLNEVFMVETLDCYGGNLKTEKDLRSDFPDLQTNGSTGPIYINNVKKGDTIALDILQIDLDEQGVMVTRPNGGLLGNEITGYETKLLPIKKDHAILANKIHVPLNKMIGVIGVAPKKGSISCVEPGFHGGNLDTKDITVGNTLYLPIFHDGGLLALGDLHAAMGDGELNGSGIEIGGRVLLRVRKVNEVDTITPIVETEDRIKIIYSDQDFYTAVRECMKYVITLLMERHKISFNDAYRLLSISGDIKVSQLVNPKVTIRISLPKKVLNF